MKKLISLVLAAVLVLSLVACGAQTEPPKSNITPTPTQAETTPATEAATEAATEPKEDDTASLGDMQGGVYTNTYAGFTVTLDEKWTFSTEEELKELDAEDMEDGASITDMMAENLETLQSINVSYQKLTAAERLAAMTTSEGEVIDEMLKEKDDLIASYAEAGITVSNVEKKTVTFLGKECPAMLTTASIEGIPYYILQMLDYSKGAFGVIITVGSFLSDSTVELLDLFKPL